MPLLSCDQIEEFEEKLKNSFYLRQIIKVTYIENKEVKSLSEYVTKLDEIHKDVYFQTKKINFRQIIEIK